MRLTTFEVLLFIIASALLVRTLYEYRITRNRCLLYVGMGGTLALTAALVMVIGWSHALIDGLAWVGLFVALWGFARAATVGNGPLEQRRSAWPLTRLFRAFRGSPKTQTRSESPSLRSGIAVGLVCLAVGLGWWILVPGGLTEVIIFTMLGLQVLLASFLFLRKQRPQSDG